MLSLTRAGHVTSAYTKLVQSYLQQICVNDAYSDCCTCIHCIYIKEISFILLIKNNFLLIRARNLAKRNTHGSQSEVT